MGARALGVGALFVNVLLVLARDGSRSNPHPTPPPAPAPAPAPPLLGQPSEGGERRHPAAGAATAVRVSGERGYLLASMYLFFLKGGSGATPLAPHLECHPARPARMLDERGERFRTLGAFSGTSPQGPPCAFCLELGALEATEGSPRTGGEFGACAERVDD